MSIVFRFYLAENGFPGKLHTAICKILTQCPACHSARHFNFSWGQELELFHLALSRICQTLSLRLCFIASLRLHCSRVRIESRQKRLSFAKLRLSLVQLRLGFEQFPPNHFAPGQQRFANWSS